MRVLLVNPPRFYELVGKNPAIIEDHRGYNPPLGILSLAGYLERNSTHEIEILDAQPYEYGYDQLKDILQQKMADVVGITVMTFTLIDVLKTALLVKQISPETKVVLGGPHVHVFPEETISLPGVDFLVQGEGERTFLSLLQHLSDLDALEQVPGLVFKRNGRIVNTGISPLIHDLDELGFPARHLVDITKYTSLLGKTDISTTMFTSRGCPYGCTFCDRPFSPVISGFRWRSAKHVADEMQECTNLGIHEAFIYDDTFTVRKDRVFELCAEIRRRKLKFRWDVRAHVNTISPELLRAMRNAGCDRIHYGVEAGNDRMLKVIRKNTTIERVKEVVKWTKSVDMEILTYFIIGQQSETLQDIQDTVNLAKQLDPNYVHFTILCPYPATAVYFDGLRSGVLKKDVWREFAAHPHEDFEMPFWEENFTAEELKELLVHAYKAFYLRPGYVFRNVSRIRSAGEFRRKVRAGLSVIGMRADEQSELAIKEKVRDIVPLASYDVRT
jgi:anaerobic magnesium-protoporphyrin IX monomethyl ester cyclase